MKVSDDRFQAESGWNGVRLVGYLKRDMLWSIGFLLFRINSIGYLWWQCGIQPPVP